MKRSSTTLRGTRETTNGPRSRSWLAAWAILACASCGSDDDPARVSYAVWAASPQDYAEVFPVEGFPPPEPQALDDQTIRQIVHASAGGDELRVRLSNLFGTQPLSIDAAGVARSLGGSDIDPSSRAELTFDGEPGVTIAPGQERWSDFLPLSLPPESELAVTLYVAGEAPVATVHSLGVQTTFVTSGNQVTATTLPAEDPAPMAPRQSYYWLTGVEMASDRQRRVVVAFGDSITDGLGSTVDANRRYPNFLSRRLTAASGSALYSVVNEGISGNRVLNDVAGPSAVSRFRRDALGQTGVTDVVILLGINDIGFGGFIPEQEVSVEAIIDGLSSLIDQAHAEGVRVFLATLLPLKGTQMPYYGEASETKRQALNAWIRNNDELDGVVDFAEAMKDAVDPLMMLAAYNSGDGLHPNDSGYEAMSDAIDLGLFE